MIFRNHLDYTQALFLRGRNRNRAAARLAERILRTLVNEPEPYAYVRGKLETLTALKSYLLSGCGAPSSRVHLFHTEGSNSALLVVLADGSPYRILYADADGKVAEAAGANCRNIGFHPYLVREDAVWLHPKTPRNPNAL